MAPYRRRRWWRRWRPRRRFYRKGRRIWKPRRRYKRRGRLRTKVRRFLKRRKRIVTLWDPDSKQKCTITGATIGLLAAGINTVNRMNTTVWTTTDVKVHPSGGGCTLNVFSLKFLYQEHRFFRNCWTHSNDGYDLAKYFGTTIYLQPHWKYDYVFWWDTDITGILPEDYWRLNPSQLLCSRNAVFVRNQVTAGNKRSRKVRIRPPANITSQWKFQEDWYNWPLFVWGMTLINWTEPFLRQTPQFIPYVTFPGDKTWYWHTTSGQYKPISSSKTLAYSPLIDSGNGNELSITYNPPNSSPASSWSSQFVKVPKCDNLPYWYSCFGQNISWDFGIKRGAQDLPNYVPWVRWYMEWWTDKEIEGTVPHTHQRTEFVALASTCYNFARMGYFVLSSTSDRINIPFMYKSHWQWGGTNLKQQPITAVHPQTNQVSVKNPLNIRQSLIYPGDTRQGLLTAQALRRFLEPSRISDERIPEPFEQRPPRYASEEEYDTTASEAEESEEEQGEKESDREIIKRLGRRVQRERVKRRLFNKFLHSLLERKLPE